MIDRSVLGGSGVKNGFSPLGGFLSARSNEIKSERCDRHGLFESKNLFGSIWSQCPACARIESELKAAEEEAIQAKKRFEGWERQLGESGIPELFMTRTLANYKAESEEQSNALSQAYEFVDQFDRIPRRGAIFHGETGTGKTHLSVGIGLELMKKHKTVRFITMQRLFRKLKESWHSKTEPESKVIELLAQADLLILDEVGIQFNSTYEQNAIFEILNERYERNKSTIFLSNLPVDDIKKILGDRVMRRLRERKSFFIKFGWDAYTPSNPRS